MPMSPAYWLQALRELSRQDPVLKRLIGRYRTNRLQARGDAYLTLARSIVGQQLSVKAAQTIWQRLMTDVKCVEPRIIAATDITRLRALGLSARKADYLIELAGRFLDGSFDIGQWQRRGDEEVISELTCARGIGRWTAEMFLIFCLLRPNVLPLDDVGLQRAMRLNYNGDKPMSKRRISTITRQWQPWCSVATWFMWRSLDPPANT